MSFRDAPGRRLAWHETRIESGFSNFLFIDKHYRSHAVLRRLFSLARKHSYQSLLIEEICQTDCLLLAEENAALLTRKSDYSHSTVHRLTFWRCLPDEVTGAQDFIGYAIFKADYFGSTAGPMDHIYEAVFPPPRLESQNNFIHCRRTYSVRTLVGEHQVRGVLYAQQNDLTYVCAHVALRTALACLLPDADLAYSRMNDLAGVDHQTRLIGNGSGGLNPNDLEAIFTGLGVSLSKIVHEPALNLDLPTEFQRDLYGYIESGCPALLGFQLEGPDPARHIVPVIGHTFNDDAWVPEAQRAYFGNRLRYFSSESWLSSYVLHDDNFGPYYCLPRHFLKKDNFRIILGAMRATTAFSAVEAEAIGFNFLNGIANATVRSSGDWYERFQIFAQNGLLVLRSILTSKAKYLVHLQDIRSWEGERLEQNTIAELENLLPDRFWMVEASAQELFSASRRKFGEILIPSNTPLPHSLNLDLLLAARLPGLILTTTGPTVNQRVTQLTGHTPIFSDPPDC